MSQINTKSGGKSIIKNNGIEGPTKRNKLGVNMDSDACREVQEFAGSRGIRHRPNEEDMAALLDPKVPLERKNEIRLKFRNETAEKEILNYKKKFENKCKGNTPGLNYDTVQSFFSMHELKNVEESAPHISLVCNGGKCLSDNSHDQDILKSLNMLDDSEKFQKLYNDMAKKYEKKSGIKFPKYQPPKKLSNNTSKTQKNTPQENSDTKSNANNTTNATNNEKCKCKCNSNSNAKNNIPLNVSKTVQNLKNSGKKIKNTIKKKIPSGLTKMLTNKIEKKIKNKLKNGSLMSVLKPFDKNGSLTSVLESFDRTASARSSGGYKKSKTMKRLKRKTRKTRIQKKLNHK